MWRNWGKMEEGAPRPTNPKPKCMPCFQNVNPFFSHECDTWIDLFHDFSLFAKKYCFKKIAWKLRSLVQHTVRSVLFLTSWWCNTHSQFFWQWSTNTYATKTLLGKKFDTGKNFVETLYKGKWRSLLQPTARTAPFPRRASMMTQYILFWLAIWRVFNLLLWKYIWQNFRMQPRVSRKKKQTCIMQTHSLTAHDPACHGTCM